MPKIDEKNTLEFSLIETKETKKAQNISDVSHYSAKS